jgi:hypothetical protein
MRKVLLWAVLAIGLIAAAGGLYWHAADRGWLGAEREAGAPNPKPLPFEIFKARADADAAAAPAGDPDLILFGDLHVHTTYSTDAFLWALPMNGGNGAHPVAQACDFARFCSGLDFWAITDHAEASTPLRWQRTKEAIRQCQAVADTAASPDLISFVGFEWTQVGRLPSEHYGHKNVIFRDLDDASVAARPIAAAGVPTQILRTQAAGLSPALPLRDWGNRQPYFDFNRFIRNVQKVPDCDAAKASKDLPAECFEQAATPGELVTRLESQGVKPLIIPHGSTWGFYTPPGTTWDKQLAPSERPDAFRLIEVFSGHGNSEEFRAYTDIIGSADGQTGTCPEPTKTYMPACQRAGQIIEQRCLAAKIAAGECAARAERTRVAAANMGVAYHLAVTGESVEDWLDSGQCTDCFLPAFNYRPGTSVQYGLAVRRFDENAKDPSRFAWGFIGSSDNHRARAGTGYKAVDRRLNTESSGPVDQATRELLLGKEQPPNLEPVMMTREELMRMAGFQVTELERQSAFFTTGGLAAAHVGARDRGAIWDAMQKREVYATSGPRILLWVNEVGDKKAKPAPMGSQLAMTRAPVFEVRALGSFKQKPGCPDFSAAGVDQARLKTLCSGECYNPTDERHKITRIEIVRVRPQAVKGEKIETLIDDPFLTLPCDDKGQGCTTRFSDPAFTQLKRDALYYVRAIQEAEPVINAKPIDCLERDAAGRCTKVKPLCYGDWRSGSSDCTAPAEPRAWSSPIFIRYGG